MVGGGNNQCERAIHGAIGRPEHDGDGDGDKHGKFVGTAKVNVVAPGQVAATANVQVASYTIAPYRGVRIGSIYPGVQW